MNAIVSFWVLFAEYEGRKLLADDSESTAPWPLGETFLKRENLQ